MYFKTSKIIFYIRCLKSVILNSTSQFRLATLLVLSSLVWPLATITRQQSSGGFRLGLFVGSGNILVLSDSLLLINMFTRHLSHACLLLYQHVYVFPAVKVLVLFNPSSEHLSPPAFPSQTPGDSMPGLRFLVLILI